MTKKAKILVLTMFAAGGIISASVASDAGQRSWAFLNLAIGLICAGCAGWVWADDSPRPRP